LTLVGIQLGQTPRQIIWKLTAEYRRQKAMRQEDADSGCLFVDAKMEMPKITTRKELASSILARMTQMFETR
jgi:hypothetical protein